jgi:hypothetical protein
MAQRQAYRGKELHLPLFRVVSAGVDETDWPSGDPIDTTNLHHLSVHIVTASVSGIGDLEFRLAGSNGEDLSPFVSGAIGLTPDKHIGPGTFTGPVLNVPTGSNQIYLVYKDLPKWVRPLFAWGSGDWETMSGGVVVAVHGWMI